MNRCEFPVCSINNRFDWFENSCVMCIGRWKNMIAIDNLPSGNVLGILAVAWAVRVSDLEDCSDWASIFAGDAFKADVVLSAVLWVSVSRERSGVGDFSGSWACESVGDLYKSEIKIGSNESLGGATNLRSCTLEPDQPTCTREPHGHKLIQASIGILRLRRSSSSRTRRT